MSASLLRRLLVLSLLVLWTAPSAGAVALGVHMALDHHDLHHDSALLDEIGLAAAHGHHHDDVVPDHEHPASVSAEAGCFPTSSPHATGVAELAAADDIRDETPPSRFRRGPPDPLFYTHCSLLL